ncbi:hypothetical protein LAZ67_3005999 [Cordylochernes scorpioides]|uniref:Integrase zinc-binding domain-containing protein n=1 Tax=Cordylochernes scorpioides TaxID=51811 RepID=A0ABY6KCM8_9ARAC|nr:hypothetical protein LAZ67_3005999 [Cordylochernes scorpioides]
MIKYPLKSEIYRFQLKPSTLVYGENKKKAMELKQLTGGIFFDISKALDKRDPQDCPHQAFNSQQHRLGVPHNQRKLVFQSVCPEITPNLSSSLNKKLSENLKIREPHELLLRVCIFNVERDTADSTIYFKPLEGCDVLGSIFMMKSCELSNGLTASHKRFGWTLLGEYQPGSDVSLAHHVTTMTISESNITNLWNLDVIGIMDPIEVKQRDQRDSLTRRHFLKTVQHSVSRRYVVSLPWTVEKAKIADTRGIAMKKLYIEQTTKKLISLNLYEGYDDIFRGWLAEWIIEKVPAEQNGTEAFYLPHRPVVKLSSGTMPIRPVFDASSKVYRSTYSKDCLEKGPNMIEMISNLLLRLINDKVDVHMMAATSLVTPLKKPTIPRLEPSACVVGARLNKMMSEALELKDVTNVLGCNLYQLIESRKWEGPSWLKLSEEYWPSRYKDLNEEEICAERKKIAVVTTMMAWIRRFINNLQSSTKVKSELSVKEIDEEELALLKLVQAECFPSHSIPGLKIYEVEGILRVKTKLFYSSDEFGFRLPVLLHGTHPLIEQIICDSRVENCYAGVQFLMNKLREKYWIVKARQTIKKIVRRCVTCRRFSAKPVVVEDAPLPATRVHNAKVFEVVGFDLAGPLYLKDRTKTWVVLFTCAVYRCVHLELEISLSTEDFLMALERFIKRRPSTIFSDNGANFVGANNFFKQIYWEHILKTGK